MKTNNPHFRKGNTASGGGQGGGNPGVKGAGSLPEVGEERAGSGIPKVAGYKN